VSDRAEFIPPCFHGESEMARRMRALDWTKTPLGSPAQWPQVLCTTLDIMLASSFPMLVLWGDDLVQLYNDGYRALMGAKHPIGLGQRTHECWPEARHFVEPIFQGVMERGENYEFVDQHLVLRRHGHDEDTYFTLNYSPVHHAGEVGGVLLLVTETTQRVLTQRQLHAQNTELEARTKALTSFAELSRELAFETDRYALVRRTQEIVLDLLPSGYSVYYELEDHLWRLKSQVGDIGSLPLQAAVNEGLPEAAFSVMTPYQTLVPLYQDVYAKGADTTVDLVTHINAVATLPLLVDGAPVGVLGVGLFEQRTWTIVDKAVMETAMQSLTLALERARRAAQLADERRKLQSANEELEAFSYSVSHDLRAPVRHIAGFASILRKTLADKLDDKSDRALHTINDAARRMNTVIDAMLELSRTARLPVQVRLVDLGQLVNAIRAELEPGVLDRNVRWDVAVLPLVAGDQDLLRQVVFNLLSNALKYTSKREETLIEVWAEERADEWLVFVKDNGAGFDPRYQDKLFGVFQRLHRADEFEGTGVGLVTVRRIVQRHGGRVWAHGTVDAGATFAFSLPKPQQT